MYMFVIEISMKERERLKTCVCYTKKLVGEKKKKFFILTHSSGLSISLIFLVFFNIFFRSYIILFIYNRELDLNI